MPKPTSSDISIIDLTPQNIADYGVCGYKDVEKHLELRRKIEWYTAYYPKGLRIKALVSKSGGYQGMIEYLPANTPTAPFQQTATCSSTASSWVQSSI